MLPQVVWQAAGQAADSPTNRVYKQPDRPQYFAFFIDTIDFNQNKHAKRAKQTNSQITK